MTSSTRSEKRPVTRANEFRSSFRLLILLTWTVPAIFGMGFLLFIRLFTEEQLLLIQTRPLEPLFVLAYVLGSYRYFMRLVGPVISWLDDPSSIDPATVLHCIQGFPIRYWGMFLSYLVLAPTVVIFSAEMYTDFVATPADWFRIHLVALIVSIIVGLPIFILIFDLFGKAIGGVALKRPILAIRTKVFLIGALVPLLIDTMLVQYYWTRTGYFTLETFLIWLLLEVLAIAGSLIFVRSFGQSLKPLQNLIGAQRPIPVSDIVNLHPRSTDELGLLTTDYQRLLAELQLHNEVLQLKNELLRRTSATNEPEGVFTTIVDLCTQAINSDQTFLIMHDVATNDLVGLAQTAHGFRQSGHFRIQLDDISLAAWVFNNKQTAIVENAASDTRVSREMCERFNIYASIATPLVIEGKVQGVLIVVDQKPRNYTYHDQALVEGLAREVALVISAQQMHSARAQAEIERSEQVELVRLLMDAIEEGIYGIDEEGLCTFINPAALRMLGYKFPTDLLGRNIHQLVHHTLPDGRPNPFESCRVRSAMLAGNTAHADSEYHWRADGSGFPVEYWSRPIYHEHKIVGAVVSFVDISERKRIETVLKQHQENLEELVHARTTELETLNRELEAFSYSVSHDLRAPLRAVDGFAQALAEDCAEALDDTGLDYLHRIRNAAQRMGSLIDDLLKLSRVSRAELHRDEVNLSEIGMDIMQQLQATDPKRRADVEISPGMTTTGDIQMLLIVLTNLLENAWKYTSNNPHATIKFSTESQNGRTVYYVRDNGAGFDMRYAEKLFSPFQRLHGAEFPGTGVGLATVQRIIQRHAGRIWATAQPGKGATFYFTLSEAGYRYK